jgi:tRNA dimethylallyltransferase
VNTPRPPLVVLGPTASGKSDVAMAFALDGRPAPVTGSPTDSSARPADQPPSGGRPAALGTRPAAPPDVPPSSGPSSALWDGPQTPVWDSASTAPSDAGSHESGPIEIVAVDSMQVYRGMDIGTAKPSAMDRLAVAHHCLDLADPEADFTVVEFACSAQIALAEITANGNLPVLVAGTGLYLRSLTDPMEVPGRWPDARAEVERCLAAEGSAALHRRLVELDPLAASRMEPGNARRVVRALEVTLGGGRPFSSYGAGIGVHPPSPFVQVGLQWPRARLAQRIEARVHAMIERGLLAEVEVLAARPAGWSRTARQALGYKELLEHLDGKLGLDEAIATVVTRTRQFAVRQERWFRRDPRVRWVPVNEDPVAEVLPILQQL